MKIFLVLSNFPNINGEAIDVVGYEVIKLMVKAGHHIDAQVIIRGKRTSSDEENFKETVSVFNHSNINFLNPIFLAEQRRIKILSKKLRGFLSLVWCLPLLRERINPYLFPAVCLLPRMRDLVNQYNSDIILSIWSWEALAATYNISGVPKFVYYGNPDHKPTQARLNWPDLFDIPTKRIHHRFQYRMMSSLNKVREEQHLRMMRQCEVTANNSPFDAKYYSEKGHARSIYLQNMWPNTKDVPGFGGIRAQSSPVKIVGSVGNLGATGNTFGLYFIGEELVPQLERKFGKEGFVIDIFGGGSPTKKVKNILNKPSIRLRGWVEDINTEIRNACVFLVLTNVYNFIVGNTRILLAWSLGACLVAHKNSTLSMPEIVHMKNALLGDSADEIADLIYRSAADLTLRQKIGQGGYETYKEYYTSDIVVPKMLSEMASLISTKKANERERAGVKRGDK